MEVNVLNDIKIYQEASLFNKWFNKAVKEAQELNRQNGIPSVYCRNGKFYYELPNGEITTETPDMYKDLEKK